MNRRFVGVVLAGSLIFSSTGAVAATAGPAAAQSNPWVALTAMSGVAPSVALCNGQIPVDPTVAPPPGVTAGCVLPVTDLVPPPIAQNPPPPPIPVPPVEPVGNFAFSPLFLALGALAAGALIYFLVKGKKSGGPNSPA